MRARTGRRLRTILLRAGFSVAAVTALCVAVVTGSSASSPASFGKKVPARAAASHRQRVNHSNTGATHSPQVLRMLDSGPASPPANSSITTSAQGMTPPKSAHVNGAALGSGRRAALQGVDVASYQHPNGQGINWVSVAKAGIQFAAVKATEGTYYRNPFALNDLAQAKAAGLSVMAYAFAIPNGNGGRTSPVAQADYLVSYLAKAGGPPPPVMLDIEYNPYGAECYGLSQSAMVTWIARFSGEIAAKTGAEPIIYGPGPWFHDCTGSTTRFARYPLWVPDYTTAPSPAITPGWTTYGFWQYSSAGTVNGINAPGGTDLDNMNPAAVPLLDPAPQRSATGGAVGFQMRPADPVVGQSLSFSAAGLPPGLTMSPAGQVTGWPAGAGAYQPLVSVTDGAGRTGSVAFGWTVTGAAATSGPAGAVKLDLGGLCLTSTTELKDCAGGKSQTWTYAQDGTLRSGTSCLTIPAAAQGVHVWLKRCAGMPAQQWRLAYPRGLNPALGGHRTTLVNPWSGMCLADPRFNRKPGIRVRLSPCDGYKNQSWALPAGPLTSQIPGMCAADLANQTANKAVIGIWRCDGTRAQAWLVEPDGTLRVNGKCLDVLRGATVSGSPVDLYACNGTGAQQWVMTSNGGGVTLVNPRSGLCLADPRDAATDGKQLVISACTPADPGISWRVS